MAISSFNFKFLLTLFSLNFGENFLLGLRRKYPSLIIFFSLPP